MAYNFLPTLSFTSETATKGAIFPNEDNLEPEVITQLHSNPDYGLSLPTSYPKWDIACGIDAATNLEFQNELASLLGLTKAQAKTGSENFCKAVEGAIPLAKGVCPNDCDTMTFAYYQWGEAFITQAAGLGDTVTKLDPTIVGYPEISFFKSEFFMPAISANETLTTQF